MWGESLFYAPQLRVHHVYVSKMVPLESVGEKVCSGIVSQEPSPAESEYLLFHHCPPLAQLLYHVIFQGSEVSRTVTDPMGGPW